MADATGIQLLIYKILQYVPGCPDTTVSSFLLDVINEFYRKSTGWRVDFQVTGGLVSGQDTYSLNPVDANTTLLYVLGVYLFPSVVGGNSRRWLYPQVRKVIGTDTDLPTTWFTSAPDQLIVYPKPDQNYGAEGVGLYVYGVCAPTAGGTYPAITTTDHLDALQWGTLARLLAIPKRPWSDSKQAMIYDRMYRREIMRVRDMANRAYGGADTPLRFPPFAGRGSQGIMSGSTAVAE